MAMTAPSMPSINPLNPTLYAFLQRKFGVIKIANPGSAAVYQNVPDPKTPGRSMKRGQCWGEYYCVCCPFCNDEGHKLWINYLYGVDYDERFKRRSDTHLACCYKNDCLKVAGRREQLENIVFGPGKRLLKRVPLQTGTIDLNPHEVTVPGTIVSLRDLPAYAPAIEYLQARNFDIEMLSRDFHIGVCTEAMLGNRIMTGRIYIPSFFNGKLVAFQGRLTRATRSKNEIKYFTSGSKSRALYNYDVARQQSCVVVVEGAPSAWRLGPIGVALFGKTLSLWQENTIATTWVGKPVFLALDYGEEEAIEKATTQLCKHNVQVIPVLFPDKRDPADYTKEQLHELLSSAADAVGVTVDLSSLR